MAVLRLGHARSRRAGEQVRSEANPGDPLLRETAKHTAPTVRRSWSRRQPRGGGGCADQSLRPPAPPRASSSANEPSDSGDGFCLGQERQRHQRISGEQIEGDRAVAGMFLDDRQHALRGQRKVFGQGTAFAHRCGVLQHSLPEGSGTDRGTLRQPAALLDEGASGSALMRPARPR